MNVAYTSPWVPPEWIASHGFEPDWMRLRASGLTTPAAEREGVCAYAGAVIDAASAGCEATALVLTTTCDQMRYAATLLQQEARLPVFLMTVPSTCQSEGAALYRDELARLGRFLVRLGGRPPTGPDLTETMLAYDSARAVLCAGQEPLSARQMVDAFARVRRSLPPPGSVGLADAALKQTAEACVPLALLGGPLAEEDLELLDRIEQAGGRLVLDATEGGERTLPARFDVERLQHDPLSELARAYFDSIPDVFRRPNDGLYRWLAGELEARPIRGVLLHRYIWCDLWHAEVARLKEFIPVPVLDLDAGDGALGTSGRTAARVEAFLEMLR